MLSILTLTTSAYNRGDKVRVIDTTRKYTAAIANIEAGLIISLSNLHFSQVSYEFFRSS